MALIKIPKETGDKAAVWGTVPIGTIRAGAVG